MEEYSEKQLLVRIRLLVVFFIIALVVSGITAFPLVTELNILSSWLGIDGSLPPDTYWGLKHWIAIVNEGLTNTTSNIHLSCMERIGWHFRILSLLLPLSVYTVSQYAINGLYILG